MKVLSGAGGWALLALAASGASRSLPPRLGKPACPVPPFGWTSPGQEAPGEKRTAARSPPFVPELPRLPAPILSGSIENSAPGRTLRAGPGFAVGSGPWAPGRGSRGRKRCCPAGVQPRGASLPLCIRSWSRWPEDANFLVCTCRFCLVLIALKHFPGLRVGVTGI